MDNKTYVELANGGSYPDNIKVPLPTGFTDVRGTIQNIWEGNCGSVTVITSKKGSVRSNHKHDSWHAIYILSGKINYYETHDSNNFGDPTLFKEGEIVFSKPDVWHRVEILEDTIFITMNSILKDKDNHEASVSRI